jgi:RNA ligase
MWQEVEAGRVNASQMGSLTVFKYTQGTHIEGTWNDVNRQARGIIFDVDGTVVARPFPKFFNLHERTESEPKNLPWKEGVEVYEKLDGSCGTGYYRELGPNIGDTRHEIYKGGVAQWRLATPGSMESDQAAEGTRMLRDYKLEHLPTDCTPVFEIIYPDNQIVVNYGGKTFLTLLAIFEHSGNEWHPRRVDQIAELCGFRRPKRYDIDLKSGDIPFEENAEGYVARFGDGTRVKVKSPVYLRLHRLLDNLSPKGVIDLIRGREYGTTVSQLPQELVLRFDDVRAHVQGLHNEILTTAGEQYRGLLEAVGGDAPRKDQAMWVTENVPREFTGLVFGMLDEKELDDGIWKMVLTKVRDAEKTLL